MTPKRRWEDGQKLAAFGRKDLGIFNNQLDYLKFETECQTLSKWM